MFTHKFWKLQKLLIIKYFSCNPKFGKYRWDRPHCAALWFVKLKQNPLCSRGNIFVLISYYFKTIIYFTGPEMTEQKFVDRPLSKSLCEHKGNFLRASEVISRVTKWKGEGAWSRTKVNLTVQGKKTTAKRKKYPQLMLSKHLPLEPYSQAVSIHHHHFV